MFAALAAFALVQGAPVEFGAAEIERALLARGLARDAVRVETAVDAGAAPEGFRLEVRDGVATLAAGGERGLMYGELELAERIRLRGAAALVAERVTGSPYLVDRAINSFLTLPWNEDTNEPDYDVAALTDPERWYFHDDDYWRSLFDIMARSRLNWLDLHGTYDIHTTRFPNLYAYFVESRAYPEVGVPKEIKAANLAQLNRVIDMAHARGVRVSLMSYEARFDVPHRPKVPYESSEEALYTYTREVVEALIRGAPKLDALGFRIGESGHRADFFECYREGVEKSGRDLPLYTRSWITRKAQVVPLARASSDFTVEIKFNGEHWGPPYPIAGGRVPGWYSYSFEDYFSDSGDAPAKRMWPGNVSPEGEPWPAQPYKVVWQVRANGTHRIFPFYEPTWVRRSTTAMKLGTVSGFSVEPLNAYYPPSPRYYTARPEDIAFRWIHQRDAPWWMLWGRLGYDPETPDEVLDAFALQHIGGDKQLLDAWKAASRVIPTAFTAFSLGPDHRNHAPELEWGGDTNSFITTPSFDSHVLRSNQESLAYGTMRALDGREDHGLLECRLDSTLEPIRALSTPGRGQSRTAAANEIATAVALLGSLGDYYMARFSSAAGAAGDERARAEGARFASSIATSDMAQAQRAWSSLAESHAASFFKPFPDRLRMGMGHFVWSSQSAAIARELHRLQEVTPAVPEPIHRAWNEVPWARSRLSWSSTDDGRVRCVLEPMGANAAWLLHKPLPSSTYFHRVPMRPESDGFAATIPRVNAGLALAAEVALPNRSPPRFRVPFWADTTPYLVVPSRAGPTPTYYSSEEALAYLEPRSLDPAKHGMLFIAPRAGNFFWRFGLRDQRKLFDAVERGMTLVVMQQDYASGRYELDWLPDAPVIESAPTNVLDPGGAFGLERFETEDILWQPIRATNGWTVYGNGAIAQKTYGQGLVILVQARLQQRMHIPGAARAIKAILELNGREKPLVFVDTGTENATYATSIFPDFCNALDIPFLTLGEVIAEEQGVVTERIPGRVWPDQVLDGRGPKMVEDFLLAKVRAKAERPVPATRAELDARRAEDKVELMRSLGLDPLPERTPLDARITGVLQRDGYKVEKLVFESRPGVVVTANLYLPDPLPAAKCPVIVSPHGHWPHKKSEPVVQARAIAQALHGYVAIVVDSPGHSFEGDTPIERRELGTHDDLRLIAAGINATAVYVWDLMRTLDYLETRPEADTTRVGITGASGGGLATVYAFAADERFDVAVPVVYATSLAAQAHNGCPCNHVPGTLQIGDRADVLAIRAPAPVLVIGARDDPEFPPEGTHRTGEKLAQLWSLCGASDRVAWKVFDGPHDYSRPMRELALGFFDRWLRGVGDGSPVPEPPIATEPADSPELRCADESMQSRRTMRDLAFDALNDAGARPAVWEEVVALNGGLPERCDLAWRVLDDGGGVRPRLVAFDSEPGLTVPGVLREPKEAARGAIVLISERGKLAATEDFDLERLVAGGYACLAIDARGFGELDALDPRRMAYLGTSHAFAAGWDAARAAEALLATHSSVSVAGRGACASQAAFFAKLIEPRIARAIGLDGIRDQRDALHDDVPPSAIQPRARYGSALLLHPSRLIEQGASNHLPGQAVDLAAELAR